ncbi:MAG: AmmeMemoRadiSam system protein A [Gammaproteobacteria bacterium]|jgi:uncharacterized protein
MPSADPAASSFSRQEQRELLQLARTSIRTGINQGHALHADSNSYPAKLQEQLACFVTLQKHGALRGCIGHLQAVQPLVKDVAENAYAAAFCDPRFPAVAESEIGILVIHISVLSPSQPMVFSSEQDLMTQIRPGIDGLILESGYHRGTFLPSVWETLPDVSSFLRHLKLKAGLSADHWSDDIRVSRYTTDSFSDAPETTA